MDALPVETTDAADPAPSQAAALPGPATELGTGPSTELGTGFAQQVRAGVIWKSGSQIVGQITAWVSTFLVIRLLSPSDYGLVAMTGVILTLLDLFNGWGFASSLVRDEKNEPKYFVIFIEDISARKAAEELRELLPGPTVTVH